MFPNVPSDELETQRLQRSYACARGDVSEVSEFNSRNGRLVHGESDRSSPSFDHNRECVGQQFLVSAFDPFLPLGLGTIGSSVQTRMIAFAVACHHGLSHNRFTAALTTTNAGNQIL